MDMQGSRALNASQQQAWDALNDPQVLKACIPGCDRIEATGEGQYAITMALKIGPVSAKFNGKIQLSDIQAPDSYTLSFEGQGGVAGFGKGTAHVGLTAVPDAVPSCDMAYTVHATVGGKIAQLGQRLIDGAAKSLAEDFFSRFEAVLEQPKALEENKNGVNRLVDATKLTPDIEAVIADNGINEGKKIAPLSDRRPPPWLWLLLVLAAALGGYFYGQ